MPAPQYIQDNVSPQEIPVATAKAVAVGDLVGQASNTLVKASDETWATNAINTAANFKTKFVGVSDQAKTNTQARVYGNSVDNLIRVNTSGVFEYDADSATYNVGDMLMPAAANNALLDQKVTAATNNNAAIMVCVKKTAASATRVRARILSQVLPQAKLS